MKYALTPSLTLNATLNPDFGQVEADPAVVNLSAFETFFSERRPFFVEGSGNYQFDINCTDGPCTGLFYSRRIGRQPRGEPDVEEDDGGYFTQPLQSTILGAAKLTGRVGAFSVGMLSAATQEERARVALGPARMVGDRRAADALLAGARPPRVPGPVVGRLHADLDQPADRRTRSPSCRRAR